MYSEQIIVNESVSALTYVPSWAGIVVTFLVFILILFIVFLLINGFKKIVYGSIGAGSIFGVYKYSHYVGNQYVAGNPIAFYFVLKCVLFIVIAYLCGHFIAKAKFIKKLEKEWAEARIETE